MTTFNEAILDDKLKPPQHDSLMPRPSLIERFCPLKPGVYWVHAPTGYGKTVAAQQISLAEQNPQLWYNIDVLDQDPAVFFHALKRALKPFTSDETSLPVVDSDYASQLPYLAQLFVHAMASYLPKPTVIVLDNYHRLHKHSLLHHLLPAMASSPLLNVTWIVTSWEESPPQWVPLEAEGKLQCLTLTDLQLTKSDIKAFTTQFFPDLDNHKNFTYSNLIDEIFTITSGWFVGVKLVAERLHAGGNLEASPNISASRDRLFQYFADVIFNQLEESTQEILLKLSLLPTIPLNLTNQLSFHEQAEKILLQLYRQGLFIELHSDPNNGNDTIIFHDLLQGFLAYKAKQELSQSQINVHLSHAANIYQNHGLDHQAYLLFSEMNAWPKCLEYVEHHAETLMANGRSGTLFSYLRKLPPTVIEQNPSALYWYGLSSIQINLGEARTSIEKAYAIYKQHDNINAMINCWAAIVDISWMEWEDCTLFDYWLDELSVLQQQASPEQQQQLAKGAVAAMTMRRMDHPQLAHWEKLNHSALNAQLAVSDKSMRSVQMLLHYTWGIGNRAKSSHLLDQYNTLLKKDNAFEMYRGMYQVVLAAHNHWFNSDASHCFEIVDQGLSHSTAFSLSVTDIPLINVALFKACELDNKEKIAYYLDQLSQRLSDKSRSNDIAIYHHFQAYRHWLDQQPEQALAAIEKALDIANQSGFCFSPVYYTIALARILAELNQGQLAFKYLRQARRLARRYHSDNMEYMACLSVADLLFTNNKQQRCLPFIKRALHLGKSNHYFAEPWIQQGNLHQLLTYYSQTQNEAEFKAYIETRRQQLEPQYCCRIFTFGQLNLFVNDTEVKFGTKRPKKPLELLMLLIALGGKEVAAEKICDALWPDAIGDAAMDALKTTCVRLRKILGNTQTLVLSDSKVSLSPEKVWVDVFAFNSTINSGSTDSLANAVALYKGNFLSGESENIWITAKRDQLSDRYIKGVQKLGKHFENLGKFQDAEALYLGALEFNALSEPIYKQLLIIYGKLKRPANIKNLYDRCSNSYQALLGLNPTQTIVDTYESLIDGYRD